MDATFFCPHRHFQVVVITNGHASAIPKQMHDLSMTAPLLYHYHDEEPH